MKVWNAKTGDLVQPWGHSSCNLHVSITTEANLRLGSDKTAVWNAKTGDLCKPWKGIVVL